MSNAPRYRLVGYDIGTAPDENGGWVHWTDHEAIVASLTAERDAALVGAVKVKPLVWFDAPNICTREKADALGGHYSLVEFDAGTDEAHFAVNIDLGGLAFVFILEPDPFGGRRPKQFPTIEAAKAAAQADYEARILAAIQPDPEAHQAALAKAWQPIETAPRGVEVGGNNAVSWMVLAWPDGEGGYHRNSGMMVGEKFYAAPAFYIGGWHGVKHYALREIEIFPTHWMPDPPPPADLAAKIGGE